MSVRRKDPLLSLLLWWTALVAGVLAAAGSRRDAGSGVPVGPGRRHRGPRRRRPLLAADPGRGIRLRAALARLARRTRAIPLVAGAVPSAAGGRVCYAARTQPRDFGFEGATLGATFSLAEIGPLLFGGAAALAVLWVWRPAYPIQSTQNLVGVGLVFWQWVMLNRVLASRAVPAASVAAG